MLTRFVIQSTKIQKVLFLTSRIRQEQVNLKNISCATVMKTSKGPRSNMMGTKDFQKVPNVLIVTNRDEYFKSLEKTLKHVLDTNRYLIYQLKPSSNDQYFPTKYDTSLVINVHDPSEENKGFDDSSLCSMFNEGLNIVAEHEVIVENIIDNTDKLKAFQHDGYKQLCDKSGNYSFVSVQKRLNLLTEEEWANVLRTCFPLIKLQQNNRDEPTFYGVPVSNFFGDHGTLTMFKEKSPIKQAKLQLDFNPSDKSVQTSCYIPIRNDPTELFNWKEYQMHLKTTNLGRNIIHCNVITSTFDLLQGKFLKSGLAVIADRQTSGKGRSANKWLSPKGCAMFSLQIESSLSSNLGKHLPLLQHLVSLAVVDSVKSMGNGYENVDLRLKWPNDIYAGQHCKIGGVVVYTSIMGKNVQVNVGCGINLWNEEPTKSINQMLREKHLNPISRELFLSQIFNQLEFFLEVLESDSEVEKEIFHKYHKYWLHRDQTVKIRSEDGEVSHGRVISLDSEGFLLVDVCGEIVQVHPDGNSFDMLQGLIIPKK